MGIAMGIRQSVTGWGALAFLALVPAGIVTPTSDSSVPTAVESLAYLTPDTGNYVAVLIQKSLSLLFFTDSRLHTQILGWCIGFSWVIHLGSGYRYGFIVPVNVVGFTRRVQRH